MCQNKLEFIAELAMPTEILPYPMEQVRGVFSSNAPLQVRGFLFPEQFPEYQALCAQTSTPEGEILGIPEEEFQAMFSGLRYHDECCAALLTGTKEEVMRNVHFLNLGQATYPVVGIFSGLDLSLDDLEDIAACVQEGAADDAGLAFGFKRTETDNVECLVFWTRERPCIK